jgi:YbgC/YbaW family acyl-CoA thioester hydrolase
MPYEHCYRLRVEFAETDMAGIVHFSNFFRYMERAEHDFLRTLGISVHQTEGDPPISLPRVNATCDYRAPLRYEDEVEIRVLVREKRTKSFTYEFHFRKRGEDEIVAVGSITVVCVTMDPETGHMTSMRIPDSIDHLIETAPKELLETRE